MVKELLDKLVQEHSPLRWDSVCAFSDGKSRTILEISVFGAHGQVQLGRIAYQMETGEIVNFFYKGYEGERPDDILDLILDLINLERRKAKENG